MKFKNQTKQMLFAFLLTLTTSSFAQNWTMVGGKPASTDYIAYTDLEINPVTNQPYALWEKHSTSAIHLMKFDGTNWVNAADTSFFDFLSPAYSNLFISSDGSIYVSYSDNANADKMNVIKLIGNTWSYVGSANFSTGNSAGLSDLIEDGSGNLYAAYVEDDINGDSRITTQMFSAGTWNLVGDSTKLDSGFVEPRFFKNNNGEIFLTASDYHTFVNLFGIYELNAGMWQKIADGSSLNTTFGLGVKDYALTENGDWVLVKFVLGGDSIEFKKLVGNTWQPLTGAFMTPNMVNKIKTRTMKNTVAVLYDYFDLSANTQKSGACYYDGTSVKDLGNDIVGDTAIALQIALDTTGTPWASLSQPVDGVSGFLYAYKYKESIVGTDQSLANNLAANVYPNPIHNETITIEIDENTSGFSVEIFDLNGKQLLNKTFGTKKASINLVEFKSGIYIAKIKSQDKVKVQKIIKM